MVDSSSRCVMDKHQPQTEGASNGAGAEPMPAGEAATQSRARQRAIPLPHALRVLRHRDLRLFFAGQAISLVGTWMQSVAQSWLVYRLTGSAALLGLVYFLSQAPVFLRGMLGGAVADRHARRDIVMLTQLLALGQ